MSEYTIVSGGRKGRAFTATACAQAVAPGLFEEGRHESNLRPIWAVFAGSEFALRPFVANLRTGRKMEAPSRGYRSKPDHRCEFLKSIGYNVSWQREEEGMLATVYHPELFRLDPGMTEQQMRFAMFVPHWWLDEQSKVGDWAKAAGYVDSLDFPVEGEWLEQVAPLASLFAAYIDRRTRCPLIADPRFHLQLFVACLDQGLASFPGDDIKAQYYGTHNSRAWGVGRFGFNAYGLGEVGIAWAVAFTSAASQFEELLSEQTLSYLSKAK